jgi:hypothetical protein
VLCNLAGRRPAAGFFAMSFRTTTRRNNNGQ